MNSLESLIQTLSRLPGLGKKSATRLAYHLLKSDATVSRQLGELIAGLKDRIKPCQVCGQYTDYEVCPICRDPQRDRTSICVVEQSQDVAVMEASREYRGTYHVLQGVLAPLDGVGPDRINLASLVERCRREQPTELILATNPTLEGDTTALYVKQLVQTLPIKVTRLALGLPVGGDLEYADRLTLARSLKGRTNL